MGSRNKILYSTIGLSIVLYSYFALDFMQDKIQDQYQDQTEADLGDAGGRIGKARKAVYVLAQYPLTGRGWLTAAASTDRKEMTGYGFPSFAATLGVPLFVLVSLLFYQSFRKTALRNNFDEKLIFVCILAFLPVLFAQAFLPSILFNMLIFQNLFQRKFDNKVKQYSS